MSDRFLPYGRQSIDDDDVAAVAAALRSDFLTTGPLVEQFEEAFAQASGAVNAVACNSGTAALHLATMAIGLGEGQAAVVPAITFLATANVVRMTGAEVVFADVDPDSGLLTEMTLADSMKRTDGQKVTAALPVHLNGQICDMPALAAVAGKNGTRLIEDACHALGAVDVGAARHAAAACFSTHPVKAIATAEGGVVTTRDAAMAARMRRLRSHGINHDPGTFIQRDAAFEGGQPNPWHHEMPEIGWNYRIPDVLCALGISQLKKLDQFIARRRQIAAHYERLLAPLAPAIRPVARDNVLHGWHLYAIRVDFPALGTTRARFIRALRELGVGTQVHYIPLYKQPYYRQRYGEISLPGTEAYYARCLSIPMFPTMNDEDVTRVVAALGRVAGGAQS
jgi:UDP-4-amino-4,6-dideoxy-N-acetyl-beta-L-altrosamine transaminase